MAIARAQGRFVASKGSLDVSQDKVLKESIICSHGERQEIETAMQFTANVGAEFK